MLQINETGAATPIKIGFTRFLIICDNGPMSVLDDKISIDPDVLNGKPTIRGKRIAVQTILEFLSNGDSIEDILDNYPSLTREDIYACLKFL